MLARPLCEPKGAVVPESEGLSRGEFLRRSALAGGIVLGGGGLLAACGGEDSAESAGETAGAAADTGAAATGPRKQGGVLHIGCGGGGKASDTLDADNNVGNEVDIARTRQLYDTLYDRGADFHLVDELAEETEFNATGDEWTVRIRADVEFHDGKTVTADDLIFSITRNFDPALPFSNYKVPLSFLDIENGITKMDDRTVRFTLPEPTAIFKERMGFPIIPVGYDGDNPVGTGPFKYKSFTPGQESIMDAHTNYWGEGPYVDQVIITNISDDTARVNALIAGQVHAINALPYAQIPLVEGNDDLAVLRARAGTWRPITMRVDAAPFDDVRVRQAFRLIVDRPQMLEQAIGGNGRIANDLYSPVDPCFASELPQREQDLEQAKSLLKSAGQENLQVTMVTAPVNAGVVEMSQVFVTQAAEAGVTVTLNQIDPGTFYGDQYLKYVFAVDYWTFTLPYLQQAVQADGPGGTFNETHFADPEFGRLFNEAMQELDDDRRCELIHEMQQIQYDIGGYIIPYYPDNIDAYSSELVGMIPYETGVSLGGWNLKDVSFA
jgi:peptide/nickel transport system substrate-binding protein